MVSKSSPPLTGHILHWPIFCKPLIQKECRAAQSQFMDMPPIFAAWVTDLKTTARRTEP